VTATDRETAAFWLGFGAAMRGAFGSSVMDRTAEILAPRMPISRTELIELMSGLPQADAEIRALMEFAKRAGMDS